MSPGTRATHYHPEPFVWAVGMASEGNIEDSAGGVRLVGGKAS